VQRALIALLVVACAFVLTGTSRGAIAPERVKTRVKLTSVGPEGLTGKVSSKAARCRKHRRVAVFYDSARYPERIGKTWTDADGHFALAAPPATGLYHAHVTKKRAGSHLTCRTATSELFRF
jgi:hypothetical protein